MNQTEGCHALFANTDHYVPGRNVPDFSKSDGVRPVRNLLLAIHGLYLASTVMCIIAPVEYYSGYRYFQ